MTSDRLRHEDYNLVLHRVWEDSPWFKLKYLDDIFPGDGDEILIPAGATLHTDQSSLSRANLDRIDTEPQREPITLVRHPATGELWIYDGHHRWIQNQIQGRPTHGLVWTPREPFKWPEKKAAADHLQEWEKGDRPWFEYHCLESDESCDADVWRRSHQQVEVLEIPTNQEAAAQSAELTPQERIAEGIPRMYRVRWDDGFVYDVFEDELGATEGFFTRPEPKTAIAKQVWYRATNDISSLMEDESYVHLGTLKAAEEARDLGAVRGGESASTVYRVEIEPKNPFPKTLSDDEANWVWSADHSLRDAPLDRWTAPDAEPEDVIASAQRMGWTPEYDAVFYENDYEDSGSISAMVRPSAVTNVQEVGYWGESGWELTAQAAEDVWYHAGDDVWDPRDEPVHLGTRDQAIFRADSGTHRGDRGGLHKFRIVGLMHPEVIGDNLANYAAHGEQMDDYENWIRDIHEFGDEWILAIADEWPRVGFYYWNASEGDGVSAVVPDPSWLEYVGTERLAAEIYQREDSTFLREPHDTLYPALFDEDMNMRPEARDAILSYFEEHVGQYFPDVPQQFNMIGSGASFNWDETGDADVQVWVPQESLTAMRDQLAGYNFPTCRDLGLDGDMEVQYYIKPGEGTPEQNLAQRPYALYDITADEWIQKPFPMTPEFYADNFLAVWSRANEVAESVGLALSTFKRLAAEWVYWNQLDMPQYDDHVEEVFGRLLDAQARVSELYTEVVKERQKAYTEQGEGIHDPRDAIVKMLEIWGIFQDLKDWAYSDMPWESPQVAD